jgi:hypothetical protein
MLAMIVSLVLGFISIASAFVIGEGKGDGDIKGENALKAFVIISFVMVLALISARNL